MRLDQTNVNSTLFNFYMIDIEEILPTAMQEFPNYFDRLYVGCALNTSFACYLEWDVNHTTIGTNMSWNCGLYRNASDTNLLSSSG